MGECYGTRIGEVAEIRTTQGRAQVVNGGKEARKRS